MIVAADAAPDVSILLVTYESADDVAACFASLETATAARRFEVVVVDNASTDASVAAIEATGAPVTLMRNPTNTGFAAAVNRAACAAAGEWLLLLNPDTECTADALAALLAFAEANPGHGLYGGRTLQPDGTVDHRSCWGEPSLRSLWSAAFGLSTLWPRSSWFDPESLGHWQRDTVREVEVVSGCLLLVPAALWRRLDGFDERFFVYGEDLDLSTRVRALDLRPLITPAATVVHKVGASSSSSVGKTVLVTAGRATWIQVHWRGTRRRSGLWATRLAVGVRALGARLTGRGEKWRGTWSRRAEWWDGFAPLPASDTEAAATARDTACT